MRGRAVVGAASLACALLAIAAVAAFGHMFHADSTVTIEQNSARVAKGLVTSRRASCVRDRRVEVYAAGTRRLYGFDRTSDDGSWRLDANYGSTPIYAKVHRRRYLRGVHTHVCRNDHSPVVESGR
jgi:hypothetical protein